MPICPEPVRTRPNPSEPNAERPQPTHIQHMLNLVSTTFRYIFLITCTSLAVFPLPPDAILTSSFRVGGALTVIPLPPAAILFGGALTIFPLPRCHPYLLSFGEGFSHTLAACPASAYSGLPLSNASTSESDPQRC
jgi:hypothetical protein